MPPGSATTPKLDIAGISHVFETPDDGARLVIQDVAFSVRTGEFVCLVGASGCGKTTLLRIIAGLVAPSRGQILVDGDPIRGPTQTCGFVFQSDSLMPWRTVNANVGLGLELRGMGRDPRRAAIEQALRLVRLERWGRHFPSELSGGMRQRVNIARALAMQPAVLLMDEPFASLDAQTREIMQGELLALCEVLDATVVFVTHQIEEAVLLADRIIVLSASPGRIREVVVPPFPRPRRPQIKRTPEFVGVVDHVWGLIASDVKRSLDDELGHEPG
jgi:NitT/TauT family transport system ATP-binding protein